MTFDIVRGELSDTDEPLPRIPPYRGIVGLRYQNAGFQAGTRDHGGRSESRVRRRDADRRLRDVRLYGSYSFITGGVLNTITARLENATNKLYRNHLNYLKDQLPEMGRNFRLVYTLGF